MHENCDPWIPSGSNNHLDWGPALNKNHKILSCSKLNRIVNYAADDLTITVESGLTINELQTFLTKKGIGFQLIFPEMGLKAALGGW